MRTKKSTCNRKILHPIFFVVLTVLLLGADDNESGFLRPSNQPAPHPNQRQTGNGQPHFERRPDPEGATGRPLTPTNPNQVRAPDAPLRERQVQIMWEMDMFRRMRVRDSSGRLPEDQLLWTARGAPARLPGQLHCRVEIPLQSLRCSGLEILSPRQVGSSGCLPAGGCRSSEVPLHHQFWSGQQNLRCPGREQLSSNQAAGAPGCPPAGGCRSRPHSGANLHHQEFWPEQQPNDTARGCRAPGASRATPQHQNVQGFRAQQLPVQDPYRPSQSRVPRPPQPQFFERQQEQAQPRAPAERHHRRLQRNTARRRDDRHRTLRGHPSTSPGSRTTSVVQRREQRPRDGEAQH